MITKTTKWLFCLLLSLGAFPKSLSAQDCKSLYRKANELRSSEKYDDAIKEYQKVLNCGEKSYENDCNYLIQWIKDNRPFKEKGQNEVFGLSRNQVLIPSQGGQYSVRVQGPGKWTYTIDCDWCSAKREGNSLIISCINENESLKDRTTQIEVFRGSEKKTLLVTNQGAMEMLRSTANQLTFPASGDVDEVNVVANTDWNIHELPKWINARKGETSITFTVEPNRENKDREAEVKLSTNSNNLTTIIKIYQGSTALNEKLSFSKNELVFDADGGDEIVKVNTDAPEWKFAQFPSWVQLTRIGRDSIQIHCAPNDPNGLIREGSVGVTTGNQILGINISQAAKPVVAMMPSIGIGGRKISFGLSAAYILPMISASSGGDFTGSAVNYALGNNLENASYSSSSGFNVNAFADIRLYKNFYLIAGVGFTHYSYKNAFSKDIPRIIPQNAAYYLAGNSQNNYSEDYTFNHLEIPVLASYRLRVSSISHMQFNLGPVVTYGLSAKMKLSGNTDAMELRAYQIQNHQYTSIPYNDAKYELHYSGHGEMDMYSNNVDYYETYSAAQGNNGDVKKSQSLDASPLKQLNVGARAGVIFEYAGIDFGIEYTYMITNAADNKFWDGDRWRVFDQTANILMTGYKQHNHYLGIKVGYTFRY